MQIFIKLLTGRTISLEVETSTGMAEILRAIQGKTGFPSAGQHLIFAGKELTTDVYSYDHIKVVDSSSASKADGWDFQINLDQPILLFYHQICSKTAPPPSVATSKLSDNGETVQVGDVRIRFKRTVRVPDNNKRHALPPDLGNFRMFNVGQAVHVLPPSVVSKGGSFISMYQREAMWMGFEHAFQNFGAAKISVGGVNALTGRPKDEKVTGQQDYVVVGGKNRQPWLDGVCTAPGVVRQFVAMPLGAGYTVEGQVTGKEDIGGIQIDVFKPYSTACGIYDRLVGGKPVNVLMTPRQLGMRPGDSLYHMPPFDESQAQCAGGETLSYYNIPKEATLHLALRLRGGGCGVEKPEKSPEDLISGFAAGGAIIQKINRDPLPGWAYDPSSATRFHLSVVNAAYFTKVTGFPCPPSPISPQTYLKLKLPWYSIYDEDIPAANSFTHASPLADVKSVGELNRGGSVTGGSKACGYCTYQLATLLLSPCDHIFCDDCANTPVCPSCRMSITHHVRFAAPMAAPGQEDWDGVDPLSLDERIVKLKLGAKEGNVYTFRLKDQAVSGPSGPGIHDKELGS